MRSDYLRGTINEGLLNSITGAVPGDDNAKLMKFHGIYVQDDRDLRDERRRQKLEPAYSFLIRLRLPGGVCTAQQWLKLDELARAYGNGSLRVTTRQTFQFHWVVKTDLKATIRGLHETLIDTIAACGDVVRGVMASVNPSLSALHAEVYDAARRVSDHALPNTRAYHEIWYGEERVATSRAGGAVSRQAISARASSRSASPFRRSTTLTSTRRISASSPSRQAASCKATTSRSAAAWAAPIPRRKPIRGSAT